MKVIYYNIPSNNRELQQVTPATSKVMDYNIPSNSRELQQKQNGLPGWKIITYQVITGNYSSSRNLYIRRFIITYQVITGNYSRKDLDYETKNIITYQVITGNYSPLSVLLWFHYIITYQVITGNYSLLRSLFLVLLIITYQVITGNYSYNVLWESSDNILKKYKWKRKSLAITPSDVNIFSQTSETLNGIAFKNIISQSQKNNTLNKRDHI